MSLPPTTLMMRLLSLRKGEEAIFDRALPPLSLTVFPRAFSVADMRCSVCTCEELPPAAVDLVPSEGCEVSKIVFFLQLRL